MRQSSLIALIVMPNVAAAALGGYLFYKFPAQAILLGTLFGVAYVGYGALAAPWITGFLEDKRAHSNVLNELMFGKYDLFGLGEPGVDPGFSRTQGGDEYAFHLPMAITGRFWQEYGAQKLQMWTQPALTPVFASAMSHMQEYPDVFKSWWDTIALVDRYNLLRNSLLPDLSSRARSELVKEYPHLTEARSNELPRPSGPFYDVQVVVALVYLTIERATAHKWLPELIIRDSRWNGELQATGPHSNALAIVSEESTDRTPSRLQKVISALASDRLLVARERSLLATQEAAIGAVELVQESFQRLSTRIRLGHRIEGICSEVGY